MSLTPEKVQEIYRRTVVVRKPTYGIVRGYHELPYVCLGESFESGYSSTRVRGKIQVSPQFIIRPDHYAASYEEIFGEDQVDGELSGRVFGFLGFPRKPVECTSKYLEIKHHNATVDQLLNESVDELERHEDITTGIIITPDSQYYPVSIERFIASVLDDEFSV